MKIKKLVSNEIIVLVIFGFIFVYSLNVSSGKVSQFKSEGGNTKVQEVLLDKTITIPVVWGDLGKQMVETGVIDSEKFEAIYSNRGGLGKYEKELLYGSKNGELRINQENSGVILNLLWGLGLSNKNIILEEGEMTDPIYGGDAGKFASTGGWSISKGGSMSHYSKHNFVVLRKEQQDLVNRVSRNIYRPCCGNSTHFPDCNHGIAMLGLLELMASQGMGEEEMYEVALQVNSYWFPSTYQTIAKYFANEGVSWDDINAKEVLGENYSSARGYQQILQKVGPVNTGNGGGCSV